MLTKVAQSIFKAKQKVKMRLLVVIIDHCDLFSFCFYSNPLESYFPLLLSLLYASWCGTTRDAILDRRREEERHKTKTDKRRQKSSCDCCSTIKDSFTMPAGVSAFSAENSLPLHTCFCIRHAWLVFMKYFASFLKNTTFIFKGHYQYMSMIIMKPLPSMHDVEESIYNSSICKKGSKNMA